MANKPADKEESGGCMSWVMDPEPEKEEVQPMSPGPGDVYRYGLYLISKGQRVRGQVSIISMGVVQFLLVFAVYRYISSEVHGEQESLQGLYEDVVSNLGTAGFTQLEASDSEEYCGRFGDNYLTGKDAIPYENAFEYQKLPMKTWKYWEMVEGDRSKLDNAMFKIPSLSLYSIAMVVVVGLWLYTMVAEFEDINDFYIASILAEQSKHAGFMLVVGEVVLIRVCIACSLLFAGVYMLAQTANLLDLILNSLGLAFLLEVDNMIAYRALLTKLVREQVEGFSAVTKAVPTRDSCHFLKRVRLCITMLCIAGAVLVRVLQIRGAAEEFSKISAMCLFLGPNPDNTLQFQGTFPVNGFCESLLQTRCELPLGWDTNRCLFDKQSAIDHCESYNVLATDRKMCVVASDQSSITGYWKDKLVEPSSTWWLGIDPVDVLRWSCLQMWTAPVLNVEPYWQHGDQTPQPPVHPKAQNTTKPFPRMRDTERTSRKFGAPFACPLQSDPFQIALGLHQDSPQPAPVGSAEITQALSLCTTQPVVQRPGGLAGDPCESHGQCKSNYYCRSLVGNNQGLPDGSTSTLVEGRCELCKECTSCVKGFQQVCGSCSNAPAEGCSPQQPSPMQSIQKRVWTAREDKITRETFFFNRDKKIWAWNLKTECGKHCAVCEPSGGCVSCEWGTDPLDEESCQPLPFTGVAAGYGNSVFLRKDGTIWVAGINHQGQLGRGTTRDEGSLVMVNGIAEVEQVAVGDGFIFLLQKNGTVKMAGLPDPDKGTFLSFSDENMIFTDMTQRTAPFNEKLSGVAGGRNFGVVLAKGGWPYSFGSNEQKQLGLPQAFGKRWLRFPAWVESHIYQATTIAAGVRHWVVVFNLHDHLKTDGSFNRTGLVRAFGDNARGQLGIGGCYEQEFGNVFEWPSEDECPLRRNFEQKQIDGSKHGMDALMVTRDGVEIDHVKKAAAGSRHTVLLKTDGTVWSTGDNLHGQLGLGSPGDSSYREKTNVLLKMDITDVVDIAAGHDFTIMLKEDGTVWGTGFSKIGMLGYSVTPNDNTWAPVQAHITNVKALAAGEMHTLYLKYDGTVYASGSNYHGQLGVGSFPLNGTLAVNAYVPVRVSDPFDSVPA